MQLVFFSPTIAPRSSSAPSPSSKPPVIPALLLMNWVGSSPPSSPPPMPLFKRPPRPLRPPKPPPKPPKPGICAYDI